MIAHGPERPNPAVLSLLRELGEAEVPLTIDERDEMLGYLLRVHRGSADAALITYFQTGHMAAEIVRRALDWRFGARSRPVRLLDFAAGFGRVSRYLTGQPDAVELTVSDIQRDAVEFQRRTFGVRGIVSRAAPADLEADGPWDAIWVASLFSHLAADRFTAWLAWLLRRLAPGGLLLFSTHGEGALPMGAKLPADGILYEPLSESDRLEEAGYGTSWVSEPFVAGTLAQAAPSGQTPVYRRFPQRLWHLQDVYAVVFDSPTDMSTLALPPALDGYLDACHLAAADRLVASGWAAVRGGAGGADTAVEVSLTVNGQHLVTVEANVSRPDVVGEQGLAEYGGGWSVDVRSPQPFRSDDHVVVTAAAAGERYVLQAGSLEGVSLYLRLSAPERRIEKLRHERELARAEIGGLRQGLAGESRRVAELDAEVNRLGWEKHVVEQRLAAHEASRLWRLRGWLRRWAGRPPG